MEDVEEVSHYIQALDHGMKRIEEGFPLSLRLIREIHAILLIGSRGSQKQPGEFRRSQNWIGGTRPGNALFVSPPVKELHILLSNFEKFLYCNNFPTIIKAGIAHVQLETLHPFLDGNGRLGRLLITLLLLVGGILDQPILYLSLYFKQERTLYYQLLQEVRIQGTWEKWLSFFLTGVHQSAKDATDKIIKMDQLFQKDRSKIHSLGRARFSSQQVWEYMQRLPQVTVPFLATSLKITPPTARAALKNLQKLGVIEEKGDQKRDKIYFYRNYFQLLEEGTTPLSHND